jgi:hypothetical protein
VQTHSADGALPSSPHLDARLAAKHPLGAFSILGGGDVFEMAGGKPPVQGPARAAAFVHSRLHFHPHGAPSSDEEHVRSEVTRLIQGSLELLGRLEVAKPIEIDLIPEGKKLASYGYPRSSAGAIGLFWDEAGWERARIALRREKLTEVPQLTVHEMAHAIHHLAFTREERDLINRALLRTFRTRAAVDEAFAIYSEREFVAEFTAHDKRAPGVYGFARQRWSEDHLFTRFVRNLYFPYRPLAGPKMAPFG